MSSTAAAGTAAAQSNEPPIGLVLLRKPAGVTSYQALSPIKRRLSSGKVGHSGTLDNFARGLLVVLVGSYSRLSPYFMSGEKRYRGLISFGSETDTLDPEGKVIAQAPPPSLRALETALEAHAGWIMQRPPAYSAIHVDGTRAYELARRGIEPDIKERRVEVRDLKLISFENGEALIDVRCSSGTYIRSLARDIALACGSRAHLAALDRLAIGPYRIEDAVDPISFEPKFDLRRLSPAEAPGIGLRAYWLVDEVSVKSFSNGGVVPIEKFSDQDGAVIASGTLAAVFDRRDILLGVARLEEKSPVYQAVMPRQKEGAA